MGAFSVVTLGVCGWMLLAPLIVHCKETVYICGQSFEKKDVDKIEVEPIGKGKPQTPCTDVCTLKPKSATPVSLKFEYKNVSNRSKEDIPGYIIQCQFNNKNTRRKRGSKQNLGNKGKSGSNNPVNIYSNRGNYLPFNTFKNCETYTEKKNVKDIVIHFDIMDMSNIFPFRISLGDDVKFGFSCIKSVEKGTTAPETSPRSYTTSSTTPEIFTATALTSPSTPSGQAIQPDSSDQNEIPLMTVVYVASAFAVGLIVIGTGVGCYVRRVTVALRLAKMQVRKRSSYDDVDALLPPAPTSSTGDSYVNVALIPPPTSNPGQARSCPYNSLSFDVSGKRRDADAEDDVVAYDHAMTQSVYGSYDVVNHDSRRGRVVIGNVYDRPQI